MFYIRISSKSPKGKTWFPFPWQHKIECYLRGDWDYIACGFCGSPSAQERYGTDNAVVVTGLAVRCTQSWMRSIARCVIKLKLNCRHWDQPLHSYPPIICNAMTKKQPVFKCHHSPSLPYESLPGFPLKHVNAVDTMPLTSWVSWSEHFCKRIMIIIIGLELRRYGWYQQCGLILYSPRRSMERHDLRCHSVVGSEQLSDVCGCYWNGRQIQYILVVCDSCFAVICKLVLFIYYIYICSFFNKDCVEDTNCQLEFASGIMR